MLAFTVLVALATAMVFGILPAFRATAAAPSATLKDGASQLAGRLVGQASWPVIFCTRQASLGAALVVFQVGLSLLLLIGGGLFIRTLQNLRNVDMGFRHDGVLVLTYQGRRPPNGARFYQGLVDRIGRLPGVVSAALAGTSPLSGTYMQYGMTINGRHLENIHLDRVGPRYFETMRTPLLAGREFTVHDDQRAPEVAILNQAFVRQYFPDGQALGRHIILEGSHDDVEVVGIVRDVRALSLREAAVPTIYTPAFHESWVFGDIVVHAGGSLSQVAAELQREAAQQAPGSHFEITPYTKQVERSLVQERLMATLAGSFGGLALLLAGIGLYGLLAYSVARRTREIGLRMALGAEHGDILRMIVRHTLFLLGGGVILGLPAAWAASRLIASMLFGLTATDPSTTAGAIAVSVVAGVAAGLVPARRAARLEPMTALRHE